MTNNISYLVAIYRF